MTSLPYQRELDGAFRYVGDYFENPDVIDVRRVLGDTIARLGRAYPGLVEATPLLGGWTLRSRRGAAYTLKAPPNFAELRWGVLSTVSFFYEALVDGPPHAGRLAPERFALAGLLCNLDRNSELLSPGYMKSFVSYSVNTWDKWAAAAEHDDPTPPAALCPPQPPSRSIGTPPLGPDQLFAGQLYCTAATMGRAFAKDFRARLQRATFENVSPLSGVILDLRGSKGGLYGEVAAAADLFLPAGPAFVARSRRGDRNVAGPTKTDDVEWDMPLVALIDGNTTGASEALAAVLRERNRALLIGARTAGFGLIGTVVDLAYEHGALKITTARLETAGGVVIEGRGVSPDVALAFAPKELPKGASAPPPEPDATITLPTSADPFAPVRFAQGVLAVAKGKDRKALLEAARALAAQASPALAAIDSPPGRPQRRR